MLQPREGTGRAGRGPGRGGKPRELPIRSRDAVAASPHRTAAAAAGMGNPRPPLSAGTPRAPPAANARGCGAESAGSPESRGASRIPGGSRIRGGGGRLASRRRRNRGRVAPRAAPGTAPGTGQLPEPAAASRPRDPAPAPHRHRETALPPAHTRGRITGGAGSPVPQNPHRCGTRGEPERNFGGRELTVRCGGVRCGAGPVRDGRGRCGSTGPSGLACSSSA